MEFKQLIKNAGTNKGFDRWGDGMIEANSITNKRCKARKKWKRLASKAVRRNGKRLLQSNINV